MVDILTKQTTNQEFLDFAVEQVHNADIVTTHAGEPSAQVCDLLLNKNGKLYIATSSQNPFFKDLIAQPKVIVDGYKGGRNDGLLRFFNSWYNQNVDHLYLDEIFAKNPYLNEIYADDLEGAKKDLRVLEITPITAGYLDYRTKPVFMRNFKF